MSDGSSIFLRQLVEQTRIPYGYEVWRDGVYEIEPGPVTKPPTHLEDLPREMRGFRKKICGSPIWISKLGRAIDSELMLTCIAFYAPDRERTRHDVWVTLEVMRDHNKLTQQLAGRGAPLNSSNARAVMLYLDETVHDDTSALEEVAIAHRIGHHETQNGYGWLCGQEWIGPGTVMADPTGQNNRMLAGYKRSGERETWFNLWREMYSGEYKGLAYPHIARFTIAAAFAGMLLDMFDERTFLIHHWGSSSSGKTALAKFALAVWGHPESLQQTLNRTLNSLTATFKHVNDMLVVYDELQNTELDTKEIVFGICNSMEKARATKEGGLREGNSWRVLVWTTGEQPLVKDTDTGGQFNRTIQFKSEAFSEKEAAKQLHVVSDTNYGYAGPEFLYLLGEKWNDTHGREEIVSIYTMLKDSVIQLASSRGWENKNQLGYAAIIATAHALSAHWLLGTEWSLALHNALNDTMLILQDTFSTVAVRAYEDRALDLVRAYCTAHVREFIDTTTEKDNEDTKNMRYFRGVRFPDGIALFPHDIDYFLKLNGFEASRVWRMFLERGWIVVTPGTGVENDATKMYVWVDAKSVAPMYVLDYNLFLIQEERDKRAMMKFKLLDGGAA